MRRLFLLGLLLPATLSAANNLRVGLLDDRAPYSDFNMLSRPDGALPEILELLSVPGKVPLTPVPAMDLPQLENMLLKREVSMVLPPPLSTPPDGVLESRPLVHQRWALISRNNHLPVSFNHDLNLSKQRILLLRNSPVGPLLTSLWPDVVLEQGMGLSNALKMLNAGAADGLVCDSTLADMLTHNLYPGRLVSEVLPGVSSGQALWMLPGQEPLLERINQRIDAIPPGATASVITRWLLSSALSDMRSEKEQDSVYFDYFVIASGIISLFLIAFLVSEIFRRRRAELGLRDALSYWQTLLNSVPTPLLVCNPAGKITHCNQTLLIALKLNTDQVIGETLEQFWEYNPVAPPLEHQEWVAAISTLEPRFSDRTLCVQGQDREIAQWLAAYCDSRNVPQGLLIGWYDISERKRLERDLAVSSQEAIRASREKSEFLARMSHEIRSPMNAILGLLELEKQKQAEPDSAINIAYAASCQLLQIVGEVLDLSKIEAGEITLQLQNGALYPLLRQVVGICTPLAAQKGLRMDIDIEAVRTCHYRMDGAKLGQILGNLLSNAIKYTDAGFVSLKVLRDGSGSHVERLIFEIGDSGLGIAEEMQEKILQPYIQVDPGSPDSTGLGLAICTQLLKLMGSYLRIESEPGRGARFSFALLLKTSEEPTACPPPELPIKQEQPLRILVVDDQPANRMVMKLQLESLGHQVTTGEDGRQAESLLMQQNFDLVLTDCQMPVMSGYQLAKRVRQREAKAGGYQVIVGCTANAFSDEQKRCLQSGMDAMLIKPLTLLALRRMISEQQQVRLDMTEIKSIAAGQPQIITTIIDELLRSSEKDRLQLSVISPQQIEQYGAVLHRQKGSFALAGFQSGVSLCQQIENAIAAGNTVVYPVYCLKLNALIMRFIDCLSVERDAGEK